MRREIKKDDLVMVAIPGSIRSSHIGRVVEIAKVVDKGNDISKHRYLLQFSNHEAKMWYFDYEVEASKDVVPFAVGNLVRYREYDMIYEVTAVYHDAGQVDVKTVGGFPVGFYRIPAEMFKLHIPHSVATCKECGQDLPQSA